MDKPGLTYNHMSQANQPTKQPTNQSSKMDHGSTRSNAQSYQSGQPTNQTLFYAHFHFDQCLLDLIDKYQVLLLVWPYRSVRTVVYDLYDNCEQK